MAWSDRESENGVRSGGLSPARHKIVARPEAVNCKEDFVYGWRPIPWSSAPSLIAIAGGLFTPEHDLVRSAAAGFIPATWLQSMGPSAPLTAHPPALPRLQSTSSLISKAISKHSDQMIGYAQNIQSVAKGLKGQVAQVRQEQAEGYGWPQGSVRLHR